MSPLLLLASMAHATVNVDVCAEFNTDLEDADADYEADDYLTTNDPVIARGVHMKVFDVTSIPGVLVANYWASSTGSYAGCLPVTLALDPAHSYIVQVYSEVDVNGQTVRVFDDHETPAITVYSSLSFHPSAGRKTVYTPPGSVWNVTLVASFAMHRSTLGNATPDELDAYMVSCGGGACCSNQDVPYEDSFLEVNPTGRRSRSKYVIAHEIGHCLMKHRTGLGGGADESLTPTVCDGQENGPTTQDGAGHYFVSEEYQSGAFWEGFAEYYSAAVFNDHTGVTDCSMYFYRTADWNNSGTEGEDAQFLDCYGMATVHHSAGFYGLAGEDYFGTYCSGGLAPNHAMEFDWVRFLWAMDVDHDMSPEEIAHVYEEARSAGDWFSNDSGWTPDYDAGNPAWELEAAADGLGYTEWASVAIDYGVAQ